MATLLDFEKPIAELECKIEELRHLSDGSELDIADEITRLESRADQLLAQTYGKLTPWQKTQVARHPDGRTSRTMSSADRGLHAAGRRPRFRRGPGDHRRPRPLPRPRVVVVGHEKGADTEDRVRHNFGMARPEGYRKAHAADGAGRALRPAGADAWSTPPGAYPGIDAEERGQAEAIARSIEACLTLRVPLSPRSSARAARAARSRSPRPTSS